MPVKVASINSSKLLIALGDGATPTEVFTHPCMINTSRGIVFGASPTETLVPFCPPDEDLPGWVEREIDSKTAEITGAGIFDAKETSIQMFWDWYNDGVSKNIRVIIQDLTIGYYAGAGLLTTFTTNGPGRRERVTFDCTIMSDGAWDFVPGVP